MEWVLIVLFISGSGGGIYILRKVRRDRQTGRNIGNETTVGFALNDNGVQNAAEKIDAADYEFRD